MSYSEKYLKKFKLLLESIKTSDIETISKIFIDCQKKKNQFLSLAMVEVPLLLLMCQQI